MNIIKKVRKKGFVFSIIYVITTVFYKMVSIPYIYLMNRSKIDEKYVVFSSRPDYSDNSKYLYEYMQKKYKNKNYKYIWLINHNSNLNLSKDNTMCVKLNSKFHPGKTLKALNYISKAKYIFFTHTSPVSELNKKEGQFIINLWHGCGYKAVEKTKYKWTDVNKFDYALVPGKVFLKTKSEFWGCDESQILTLGYPRYDLLLQENVDTKKYIEKLCMNRKLIIWMPTFRKTEYGNYPEEKNITAYDLPLLNSDKQVIKLNEICREKNIFLCIKRHPMQLEYSCEKLELSNIRFISNESLVDNDIDLYSLLRYTDGLITDYSSVAIDYLLLNKPIGFTLSDFDSYSKTRGFVFDNPKEYMPGHHIYNFDDMIKYIDDVSNNNDMYQLDRKKIFNDVHNPCDNYCERILKLVENISK